MNESIFRDYFEKSLIKHLELIDEELIVKCGVVFTERFYNTPMEDISTKGLNFLIGFFPEIKEDYLVMVIRYFVVDIFNNKLQ